MVFHGIDLHSDSYVDGDFIKRTTRKYFIDPDSNRKFIKTLSPEDYVAIEASTNSFAFAELIKPYVKDVFIIDPFKFKLVWGSMKKTDKIDAKKLSQMLGLHVQHDMSILPTVTIPPRDICFLRSLFTTYNIHKKQIVMVKNRIRSILRQNLKPVSSKEKIEKILSRLDKIDLPETARFEIMTLSETLDSLVLQEEKIKDRILIAGRSHEKEIDLLTSINGVSVFMAIAIITDIIDVKRFKNGKAFTSYLRSAPKIDATNKTVHIGKTNKHSRKLSISLVLQSITHFKKSNPNIKYFSELKSQQHKKAGKVRMAIARKMFLTIYYMLLENQYYRFIEEKNHNKKMTEYKNLLKKNKININ